MTGVHGHSEGTVVEHAAHKHLFDKLEAKLEPVFSTFRASLRPLPNKSGDGTYVKDKSLHASLLKDVSKLSLPDVITIKDLIDNTATSKPIDDRTYYMERLIDLASQQPLNSKLGEDVTNGFLNELWSDLKHPPISYLEEKFKFRQADGSFNNIRYPQVGAAKSPYARTVRPKTALPFARPDPGLLFDVLMARPKDKFTPHPTGISSMLFYLGILIIHDVFYTSHVDQSISLTSSYLDLAPLYGNNQDEQNAVRTMRDGKLKPDVFSAKRILGQPPGVGLLLIMFNRFHNDAAEKLAMINEAGRFTKPQTDDDKAWAKYDNDLFQTARLITCGLYVNIILKDYVRTILKLNQTDSLWDLDPRTEMGKTLFGTNAAQGTGNQVSAEFNLVYRWHSVISQRDERWTEDMFERVLGPNSEKLSHHEIVVKLFEWEQKIPDEPSERVFAGLERNADGSIPDEGLVEILSSSVDDPAGAFGANKVPRVLRSVEIMGIMQSRRWNLATLNEFRAYFNLKQYTSFDEINPDPDVAEALRHLYDTPDNVELYPGIVAEAAKDPVEASGLCPSFTVSRAVLSDAVALVRGDRFYTVDFTPQALTNWGYTECGSDIKIDEGQVMYKLILRAFPQWFRNNSVYAHYPFVTPVANREILQRLGRAEKYDWHQPQYKPLPTFITSYKAVTRILDDRRHYHVTWGESIRFCINHDDKNYGGRFMLATDNAEGTQSRASLTEAVFGKSTWTRQVKVFFEATTLRLLRNKSYRLPGLGDDFNKINMVDIVRDVGNLAPTHFGAEMFFLPLKTEEHPRGLLTEDELYLGLALGFAAIFYDVDTAKSFPLRQAARMAAQQLGHVMQIIASLSASSSLGSKAVGWAARSWNDHHDDKARHKQQQQQHHKQVHKPGANEEHKEEHKHEQHKHDSKLEPPPPPSPQAAPSVSSASLSPTPSPLPQSPMLSASATAAVVASPAPSSVSSWSSPLLPTSAETATPAPSPAPTPAIATTSTPPLAPAPPRRLLPEAEPISALGSHMIDMLVRGQSYDAHDVAWTQMLPTLVGMVGSQAQLFAQVFNFYLSHPDQSYWQDISRRARLDTAEEDEVLMHYWMEGGRHAASAGLFRQAQKDDTVEDGDKTIHVKTGETVLCDLVTASMDPEIFPNPTAVDITRPLDSYIHYGWGSHQCWGLPISQMAGMTMLKTVARLDNVRPVAGPQGRIPVMSAQGGFKTYLTEDGATIWPFPASMKVHFDGDVPEPCLSFQMSE